jgi:hypothetical protein
MWICARFSRTPMLLFFPSQPGRILQARQNFASQNVCLGSREIFGAEQNQIPEFPLAYIEESADDQLKLDSGEIPELLHQVCVCICTVSRSLGQPCSFFFSYCFGLPFVYSRSSIRPFCWSCSVCVFVTRCDEVAYGLRMPSFFIVRSSVLCRVSSSSVLRRFLVVSSFCLRTDSESVSEGLGRPI